MTKVPKKLMVCTGVTAVEEGTYEAKATVLEITNPQELEEILTRKWTEIRKRGERPEVFIIDETWFKEVPEDVPDGILLFTLFGRPVYFSRFDKHIIGV